MLDTLKVVCVNSFVCNAIENTFKVLGNESIGSRQTKYGKIKDYLLLTKRNGIDDNDDTSLKITINKKNGYVRIEGSLRKWYFGKYSFQDFKNTGQLKKAVSILANTLGVNTTDIMQMRIKRLDLGKNIWFGKDFAFIFFTNTDVENRVGNVKYYGTGFELKYQNYKVTIYNKLAEMTKRDSDFKGAKIIAKQRSLVRAEVQLKSKNGIENKLKNIFDLYDVCSKWNDLERFWKKCFLEIKFESCSNKILVSPEEIKSTKDITNWVKAVGINTVGLNRIKAFATYSNNISTSHKSRYLKGLRLLVTNFTCKNSFEAKEFKDKVASINNIDNNIL